MSESGPPPGWYADSNRAQERYWDGVAWTEHYRPAPAPYHYSPYTVAPAFGAGTNGFAIASMVLGILWLYWIGSLLALIFGYIALNQIKRTGQGGRGMAIAGVVLGWVGIGAVAVIIVVALVTAASSCSGGYCS